MTQPTPRRRLLADISPLKESRDFRLLFVGNAVSYVGRQLTVVAIPFQVYLLTNSSLAVGLTGRASLGPLVVMSLVGGAVADAVDRRKLLLANVVAQAATSVALAVNASLDHPALWLLYVLGALNAGLWGIDLPTRNAMVPGMRTRFFIEGHMRSGSGTFRTWKNGLTMSVLEGKADFPVAHPDFSV